MVRRGKNSVHICRSVFTWFHCNCMYRYITSTVTVTVTVTVTDTLKETKNKAKQGQNKKGQKGKSRYTKQTSESTWGKCRQNHQSQSTVYSLQSLLDSLSWHTARQPDSQTIHHRHDHDHDHDPILD
jgi:hypothetical protein